MTTDKLPFARPSISEEWRSNRKAGKLKKSVLKADTVIVIRITVTTCHHNFLNKLKKI